MPLALELTGVGHSFGDRVIFEGVDLEVHGGTSLAIVGPSGVGKSTLLGIIGGLVAPTVGSARLSYRDDGSSVGQAAIKSRWITQTSSGFGSKSVFRNVLNPLLLDGLDRVESERRALMALALVGIEPLAGQKARRLSGGELQRLAVARAIAAEPDVLLADEPTGNLDNSNTKAIIDLLLEARPRSSMLFIVTHDQEVARSCELVYRLASGGLVVA